MKESICKEPFVEYSTSIFLLLVCQSATLSSQNLTRLSRKKAWFRVLLHLTLPCLRNYIISWHITKKQLILCNLLLLNQLIMDSPTNVWLTFSNLLHLMILTLLCQWLNMANVLSSSQDHILGIYYQSVTIQCIASPMYIGFPGISESSHSSTCSWRDRLWTSGKWCFYWLKIFLSPNQQCRSTEVNTIHSSSPVTWPYPLFIQYQIPVRKGTAPLMPFHDLTIEKVLAFSAA